MDTLTATDNTPLDLNALQQRLAECLLRDRHGLGRRLHALRRRAQRQQPFERGLRELENAIEASRQRCRQRQAMLPTPRFDESLPINQRRAEIAAAIGEHQVVVVCGETGSGKTTQLPKICLQLGLGAAGSIAHTQPRRIAARSVAARISEELGCELGTSVGYKVRFSDRVGPDTLVKLMTDGMLLAETQSDRWLSQYQVIIVDEAHERSLNIDFLLGYLSRLLPRRPELKLIITSATIDPRRFADHFGGAPVIEVSGRSYPVELRYRPLAANDEDERERDQEQAILDAVDELAGRDRGDILVFLSGEREIRETTESLRKHKLPDTELLPLYARLSASEQNRVFQTSDKRRIVLATNVAETSLTVPGIRYVVDPGSARISRYSHRSKVQRLPVEKISRASAAQRSGRCGRVAAGVCIRLYSEEDLEARPAFTDAEILRTNLAAVILQMCALNLGEIGDFPFIDPPDRRQINDGFKLLFELQAVDEQHRITALGRRLAKLPVDPRLGRMIMAACDEGALTDVLVIASALAIQDPRERPLEHQQAADQQHRRFSDEQSDFQMLLNLWRHFHEQARQLSKSKLRRLCKGEFLSYVRMREWQELHRQLHSLVSETGMRPNSEAAEYAAIHRALLSGLLGHIGNKQQDHAYLGARNRRFHIFPGSGLFKRGPKWLMAAELVETNRLYARVVARIQPAWVEGLAEHLVKRSHSEPHWAKRAGQVVAKERVTLYGLPIATGRKVNFGPIDPPVAREIFINDALVGQNIHSNAAFLRHNRDRLRELEALEAKIRRRDLLVGDDALYAFYDQRLPAAVYSTAFFERWRATAEREQPELLLVQREHLLAREMPGDIAIQFPDALDLDGLTLPLSYRFDPSRQDDGITLRIPLAALNQVDPKRLDWLVPGLLGERMAALLKSLPKQLRKSFVPVPNYVSVLLQKLTPDNRRLTDAMADQLEQMTAVAVPSNAWNVEALPDHLAFFLQVLDPADQILAQGRDLDAIQRRLHGAAADSFGRLPTPGIERDDVREWDFGELPRQVELRRNGITLKGYPALASEKDRLALRLIDSPANAETVHRQGLHRLITIKLRDKMKHLKRNLPSMQTMSLHFVTVGTEQQLRDDLTRCIIDRAFFADADLPRDRAAFEVTLEQGRKCLLDTASGVGSLVGSILAAYHQVRKRLSDKLPPSWRDAESDINQQLAGLIYPGFVSATPQAWLPHLPRYLKAIELRLEKLRFAPDKDRQRMSDIARLCLDYQARANRHAERGISDPELVQFRWMLEELRVSQFAQELKTALPVSVKRLESQWKKVA